MKKKQGLGLAGKKDKKTISRGNRKKQQKTKDEKNKDWCDGEKR